MNKITNKIKSYKYDEFRRVFEVELENKEKFLFTRIRNYIFEDFLISKSKEDFLFSTIFKYFSGVKIN